MYKVYTLFLCTQTMSINTPWNSENLRKKPSLLWKISKKLKEAISPVNNEEAWAKFSPETQKEMLKSLEQKDNIDLYSIDLKDFCDVDFYISRWEIPTFKEWIVQKDGIWNYITISWIKCREWQPGITGFTYENINTRYNNFEWLTIWFCDKWVFEKKVDINNIWAIPTFNLPDDIEEELWWPFYEVDYNITEWPLSDVKWYDIYKLKNIRDEVNMKMKEISDSRYVTNTYNHSENWKESDNWDILKINWTEFKPFNKGAAGFVYKEFSDKNELYNYTVDKIMLAEYKDWKMVWKWLFLSRDKSACVICR